MESSHLGILPKVHYSAMPNNRMESDASRAGPADTDHYHRPLLAVSSIQIEPSIKKGSICYFSTYQTAD